MLHLHDLTVRYPDWEGRYTLDVARGQLVAVLGPSGGGKSTLLHAIAGFEPVAGGTLSVDGTSLLGLAPARRPVAIVFQDHNLLPGLTAARNAALALSPRLRLSAGQWREVEAALDRVGLAGLGERVPAKLSGGQRQRVALARALLTTRPLLLLDEPLTGLDPDLRADMMALIDALRRETGRTVLMTTHTPEDVAGRADAVVTVRGGRVLPVR